MASTFSEVTHPPELAPELSEIQVWYVFAFQMPLNPHSHFNIAVAPLFDKKSTQLIAAQIPTETTYPLHIPVLNKHTGATFRFPEFGHPRFDPSL